MKSPANGSRASRDGLGRSGSIDAPAVAVTTTERRTRAAIVSLLLEDGPVSATVVASQLGLSPAGVRRHLEALIDSGEARVTSAPGRAGRGRGRPAKLFALTAAGRSRLSHAYDDLAGAAMRHLREIGGDGAVEDFARRRVQSLVADVTPVDGSRSSTSVEATAEAIASALTDAGFAASTRHVGSGVQICQHHCPVSHVAAEFPELCIAERDVFAELLGTHVQRLATIANGDHACTTHVPLNPVAAAAGSSTSVSLDADGSTSRPRTTRRHPQTTLRKELA